MTPFSPTIHTLTKDQRVVVRSGKLYVEDAKVYEKRSCFSKFTHRNRYKTEKIVRALTPIVDKYSTKGNSDQLKLLKRNLKLVMVQANNANAAALKTCYLKRVFLGRKYYNLNQFEHKLNALFAQTIIGKFDNEYNQIKQRDALLSSIVIPSKKDFLNITSQAKELQTVMHNLDNRAANATHVALIQAERAKFQPFLENLNKVIDEVDGHIQMTCQQVLRTHTDPTEAKQYLNEWQALLTNLHDHLEALNLKDLHNFNSYYFMPSFLLECENAETKFKVLQAKQASQLRANQQALLDSTKKKAQQILQTVKDGAINNNIDIVFNDVNSAIQELEKLAKNVQTVAKAKKLVDRKITKLTDVKNQIHDACAKIEKCFNKINILNIQAVQRIEDVKEAIELIEQITEEIKAIVPKNKLSSAIIANPLRKYTETLDRIRSSAMEKLKTLDSSEKKQAIRKIFDNKKAFLQLKLQEISTDSLIINKYSAYAELMKGINETIQDEALKYANDLSLTNEIMDLADKLNESYENELQKIHQDLFEADINKIGMLKTLDIKECLLELKKIIRPGGQFDLAIEARLESINQLQAMLGSIKQMFGNPLGQQQSTIPNPISTTPLTTTVISQNVVQPPVVPPQPKSDEVRQELIGSLQDVFKLVNKASNDLLKSLKSGQKTQKEEEETAAKFERTSLDLFNAWANANAPKLAFLDNRVEFESNCKNAIRMILLHIQTIAYVEKNVSLDSTTNELNDLLVEIEEAHAEFCNKYGNLFTDSKTLDLFLITKELIESIQKQLNTSWKRFYDEYPSEDDIFQICEDDFGLYSTTILNVNDFVDLLNENINLYNKSSPYKKLKFLEIDKTKVDLKSWEKVLKAMSLYTIYQYDVKKIYRMGDFKVYLRKNVSTWYNELQTKNFDFLKFK